MTSLTTAISEESNDDLAHAYTLPAHWYRSDDLLRFQEERRKIFAKEWHYFARESQLAHPGDYVAGEIAGYPLFVIRDREGQLKGFHNVCRHRAGPLLWEGSGRCDVLRCRYHGWVYDMAGRLRKAPDFGSAAEFDLDRFQLFPLKVDSWRGLVFVNMDSAAAALLPALGRLVEDAAAYPLEQYEFHSEIVHEIDCNWKTYVENYMEGYHVVPIHPGLAKEIDVSQYEVINKDRYALHRSPQRDGASYSGLWIWRFPILAMNVYDTGMNIERMLPLGPSKTRLIYHFFFRDLSRSAMAGSARAEAAMEAVQSALAISREVTLEDKQICEAVQKNLDAGLYEAGRLSPRHENGVWYFQNLVRKAMLSA